VYKLKFNEYYGCSTTLIHKTCVKTKNIDEYLQDVLLFKKDYLCTVLKFDIYIDELR